MKRIVKVRSGNPLEMRDRFLAIKERIRHGVERKIGDVRFDQLSYTDATMMLVETDITVSYRKRGQEKLFKSDPNYWRIMWSFFAPRFLSEENINALAEPSELYATMLYAVSDMAGLSLAETYDLVQGDWGLKASFQRTRMPDGKYYNVLHIDKAERGIEGYYEAAVTLACCAVDAYLVNFLNLWADLDYGMHYSALDNYITKTGVRKTFSIKSQEEVEREMYGLDTPGTEPFFVGVDYAAIEARVIATMEADGTLSPEQTYDFNERPADEPATIDCSESDDNWRNNGINRLLP